MKLIELTCKGCGASLEVDIDNLQAYCPYCGKKLLFDLDQMEIVLAEKEKTKRTKIQNEYRERREERKIQEEHSNRRLSLSIAGVCMIVMIIGWMFLYKMTIG